MLARFKALIPDRHPLRLAWHRSKGLAAAIRYRWPARKLTVIGITGTDGKTTTVAMTAHILAAEGIRVAELSTAAFRIGAQREWNATQKTSPSPFTVQRFLRRAADAGCTHAVLEYSSHGLVQGRTLCTRPRVAALTNISPEHLDYHGSMEQYRRDKAMLFRMLRGRGTKVLNGNDPAYAEFAAIRSKRTVSFWHSRPPTGTHDALWLSDIEDGAAVRATLHAGSATHPLRLRIPGAHNLENAMCAIGCVMGCGVTAERAARALESFDGVRGRMERIDAGQPFSLYIDFTVTPASYERTLATLKAIVPAGKRLLVLTGSCGCRMREKRPEIGRLCSRFADVVVVTNEDPYLEDPDRIIAEVWSGIDASKTDAHKIPDRRAAIEFILGHARPGDVVVLCGKGSDTTMWLKNGQVPWDERAIALRILGQHPPADA